MPGLQIWSFLEPVNNWNLIFQNKNLYLSTRLLLFSGLLKKGTFEKMEPIFSKKKSIPVLISPLHLALLIN